MPKTLPYVCADCGNHQDNMNSRCEKCCSYRVITVGVAKQLLGEDYMSSFQNTDKKDAPKYPILSLRDGQILYNVKMLSDVLRAPGSSKHEDRVNAAECVDALTLMVDQLREQLLTCRIAFSKQNMKSNVLAITLLLEALHLD